MSINIDENKELSKFMKIYLKCLTLPYFITKKITIKQDSLKYYKKYEVKNKEKHQNLYKIKTHYFLQYFEIFNRSFNININLHKILKYIFVGKDLTVLPIILIKDIEEKELSILKRDMNNKTSVYDFNFYYNNIETMKIIENEFNNCII